MCDMTHSYVRHDWFICVTWLIHMCHVIHSYVWHDSFICVTWLIHMCDMTHSHMWHDSFIRVTCFFHLWPDQYATPYSIHSCQGTREKIKGKKTTRAHYCRAVTSWEKVLFIQMWCDVTPLHVTWLIDTWHNAFVCDMIHPHMYALHVKLAGNGNQKNTWGPTSAGLRVCERRYSVYICDITPFREGMMYTHVIYMWHDSLIRDITHSCVT